MALTAFFMNDKFSDPDCTQLLGPFGESLSSPLINALDDRPRIFWQTPTDAYFSVDVGKYLDIKEGGGSELNILLPHMAGRAAQICAYMQDALNNSASTSLTYTVNYNNNTAKFEFSASGTFSLLFGTGTNQSVTEPLRLWLGYSKADLTGAQNYAGDKKRYGTDHWAVFKFGTTMGKGFTLGACVLDGGEDVSWNTANSVVKLYGADSVLSLTDRSVWEASAAEKLTFSNRPTEDQNKLQVAFKAGGGGLSKQVWVFSWRYFDEDPSHAVGIIKALVRYGSSTRQVAQLSGHGLKDTTIPLGVKTYYPNQHLQHWVAPLTFDNWLASDYRNVVTEIVREGRTHGLVWSLRWSDLAEGVYNADEEADKGFLLWCSLQDYSQDDYGGAASDYISGEITLEQVR